MRSFSAMIGVVVVGCLAACGGDKPGAGAAPPQAAEPPSAPTPQPAAAAAVPTPAPTPPVAVEPAKPDTAGVVHITSSDQMRYSATRIEISAGQKIKIELKNAGALPKEVMGHDLVVLKPGSDINAFAIKAMAAKATDYIPADASDQIVAHTRLLGPGESQTLEFDAPAGTYPFLCSFPGHVGLMNGVLVVQ
jgi:azurin